MSDGTNDRCVISAKYDACLSFPLALFLAEIWVNNLGLWAAFFPQGCRFRRGFRSVMPPPNSAPLILGAALFVFLQPLAHSSHLFRNCPFQMCIYVVFMVFLPSLLLDSHESYSNIFRISDCLVSGVLLQTLTVVASLLLRAISGIALALHLSRIAF